MTAAAPRNPSGAWFKTRRRLGGVVFLAFLALLAWLAVAAFNKQFTPATMVTLYTDNTGNEMNINADVTVRGVDVGEVRSITANGNGARLELAINPGVAATLPANVTAQMLPTTLFGERYVALMLPSAPSAQTLADVRVISQDRSADAIELEKVLNDLLPMLTAVQPAKLSVTLTAMADALQGQGTTLGQTLDQINSYLKRFDPQLPALDKDIQELVQVTKTYNQAAPDLVQALHDFSVTSQTVASESANLNSLYSVVTAASKDLTTFLNDNDNDIINLSANSVPSLQVLARYSAEFPCVFQGLTSFIPNMDKALGKGTDQPGLHASVDIVPALPPYKYKVNTPRYGDDLGPHCYSVPFTGTPLNDGGIKVTAAGLGSANSPQENQLITELASPKLNVPPDQMADWSSVLLGPLYRGTTVPVP